MTATVGNFVANRDFGQVPHLARQMKILIAPVLALTLLAACAQSTAFGSLADGPCTVNQEVAITKHLSAQIDALAARNWELAYSYASGNFRFSIPLRSLPKSSKRIMEC
jgi:hypothetical protein